MKSVVLLALIVLIGWPAVATVWASIEGGQVGGSFLTPVAAEVSAGGVRRPLGLAAETLRLVAATEAIALPIGLPLALVLFRTDVFGRRTMLGVLGVSAFVPMPLHAAAWLGAFGNAGRSQVFGGLPLLAGWPGAAFVHAMAALPWILILAGVGLQAVEPELEESALIERPGWWVAVFVSGRRALGALAGAALAVAVITAGEMTVTDLLQVRTYAEEAYLQYNLGNGPAAAGAVALPPLVLLGALVTLGARALLAADPARLPSSAVRARLWRLGRWRGPVSVVALAFVAGFVALPIYSLVWRAGRVGGAAMMGRPPRWSLAGLWGTLRFAWNDTSGPLMESAALAAIAATAALVLAWSLAWLARTQGFWRWVSATSVALALAAPGPVAGMALVFAYRDVPRVYDSAAIVVLAGVLRTFPYALLILWPAVRALPQEFLDAAAVDGLGPWGVIRRVALPLTRGALFGAWGVAFVLALGELPATNLVTPPGSTPLCVVIWGLLHTGVESHLAGVVLVMLGAVAIVGAPVVFAVSRLAFRSGRGS